MYLSSKALGPKPDQDFLDQLIEEFSVGRTQARRMLGECLQESQRQRELSRQLAVSPLVRSGAQPVSIAGQ
jgi:hypothetical protein